LIVFAQDGPPNPVPNSDPNPTGYQGGGSSRLPYIGDLFREQSQPVSDDVDSKDSLPLVDSADSNSNLLNDTTNNSVVDSNDSVLEEAVPAVDVEALPVGLPSAGVDSVIDLLALSILVGYLIHRNKILA
jgi:hypothetical protein